MYSVSRTASSKKFRAVKFWECVLLGRVESRLVLVEEDKYTREFLGCTRMQNMLNSRVWWRSMRQQCWNPSLFMLAPHQQADKADVGELLCYASGRIMSSCVQATWAAQSWIKKQWRKISRFTFTSEAHTSILPEVCVVWSSSFRHRETLCSMAWATFLTEYPVATGSISSSMAFRILATSTQLWQTAHSSGRCENGGRKCSQEWHSAQFRGHNQYHLMNQEHNSSRNAFPPL